MPDLETIVEEALSAFAGISDADELEQVKARYVGKSGALTQLSKTLGKLPPAARPAMGSRINAAKDTLEEALRRQREAIRSEKRGAFMNRTRPHVTLPGR